MAHWFHRNLLKASAPLTFDLGRQASTSSTRKLCSDIRVARAQLLDLLPNPSHDVSVVKKACERYMSYLDGFISAVEDAKTSTGQPHQQTREGGNQPTLQETSGGAGRNYGHSKLRNAVKITWTNSLGGKNISQNDFIFEQINMLFNVSLWLTKHAAMLSSSSNEISEDDAKEVHRSLREAAGIFKHIEDNILNRLYETPGDGCDLDQRILTAYEIQCKAEAQEVTLARAIELKHTASLIAALAIDTSQLFMTADDALKSLDENLVMKWRKYFQFKSVFYRSYAHCYNGNALLAKDRGGEAVRSLKESMALFVKAESLAKEYAKTKGPGVVAKPQQHPFFLRLGPIVHRMLEKTERENGMIYHEKVPEEVPEIDSKMKFGLANPVEYEVPARSPEWSAVVYNGFVIYPTNEKANDKEDTVKAVKEISVEETDKHPGNSTGCAIS